MAEETKNNDLNEFLFSIYNLSNSDILQLADDVSHILQAIAGTDRVYDVIAECIADFNFANEWAEATKNDVLVLPEDEAKRISFIFCVLSNIEDKNLDLANFLKHYFAGNETVSPFELFCNEIIFEFRDLILKKLGIPLAEESEKEAFEVKEETIEEVYGRLYNSVILLYNQVLNSKKIKLIGLSKDDLLIVLSSYEIAIRENQINYFYAFNAIIKSTLRKAKRLIKIVSDINLYTTKIIKRG